MGGVNGRIQNQNMYRQTNLNMSYFLVTSSDDEEGDTVGPSVPLLSEKRFFAKTSCYGFEEDEEEENDEEVDNDNEQKKDSVRDNKRKRLKISNNSKKYKK